MAKKMQCEKPIIARRVSEWAVALGVSERTLWERVRKGEIKATKISKKITLIEATEIENFLAKYRGDGK